MCATKFLFSAPLTYMKPACVCSRLSQRAGADYDLTEEVGQLIFQLVPCQTFIQGPACWVLPEILLQMPRQSVILGPRCLDIPEHNQQNFLYTSIVKEILHVEIKFLDLNIFQASTWRI